MLTNRSAPAATVVPVLVYPDVSNAIDWLSGAFGFVERLRAPGRDGVVSHAQLLIGESSIMIGGTGSIFQAPHAEEVDQYVLVHVENVDRHFERARSFGAQILQPPTDQPFGERQYVALRPCWSSLDVLRACGRCRTSCIGSHRSPGAASMTIGAPKS